MLKFFGVLLCIVAFIRPIQMQTANNCRADEINECEDVSEIDVRRIAEEYFTNKTLPDEAFLKQNCGKLVNYMDCVSEKFSSCRHLKKDDANMRKALELICDENSNMRKIYAKNIDCINEQIPYILKCIFDSWNFTSSQFENVDSLTDEERQESNCLYGFVYTNVCILGIPADKCDQQIYDFDYKFVKRFFVDSGEGCSQDVMEDINKKYESKIETWKAKYIK